MWSAFGCGSVHGPDNPGCIDPKAGNVERMKGELERPT